jgi:(2Fe-2S) ferredoxin
MYNHVTPKDVAEIVECHLEGGRPVRRLMERSNERAEKVSGTPGPSGSVAKKDGDT